MQPENPHPPTVARLRALADAGWRFTRDGSTATARREWHDPDDPDSTWQVLVLATAGHGARCTVEADGFGLTERSPDDVRLFRRVLAEAQELLAGWAGALPDDGLEP